MNKIILAVAIGLVLIGGGITFLWQKGSSPQTPAAVINSLPDNQANPEISIPSEPWIEVISPEVKASAEKNTPPNRILQSGDALHEGETVSTNAKGKAIIYFPDGSVLRLDSNTTIQLNTTQFNPKDEKLVVRVSLAVGRVWSKIIELTTPESLWEVKTSNAIATVRGTAFGMGFKNGRSRVLGSENSITLNPIDIETGKTIEDISTKIEPKKFAELTVEDIAFYQKNPDRFTAKELTKEFTSDPWFIENQTEDQEIDQEIRELKQKFPETSEFRKKLRQLIQEKKESFKITPPPTPVNPIQTPNERMNKSLPSTTNNAVKPQTINTLTRIEITSTSNYDTVAEGSRISFKATGIFSDGTRKDITKEVLWQVVGPIGAVSLDGVFTAKLDEFMTEIGEGPGAVAATLTDPISKKKIEGTTKIFKVRARIDEGQLRDG